MSSAKRRGYMVERKVRMMFEKYGWKTIRAGASLGEADLVCLKNSVCILIQVKSTKRKKLYYYDYTKPTLQGFQFLIVVDFGYGKIRISKPKKTLEPTEGILLEKFLKTSKPKSAVRLLDTLQI